MYEEFPRPNPVAVGAVAVVLLLLVFFETLRAWVAAVAGPLLSVAIIALAVLWLGGKL